MTAPDAENGGAEAEGFSYWWLIPTCRLNVVVDVGNGHTARLSAAVIGQSFGPALDQLVFDAGPTEPLIGQILNIVTTVTVGAGSPSPPPSPLVTVKLFQKTAQDPTQDLVVKTKSAEGVFDANGVCRLDFGILLK